MSWAGHAVGRTSVLPMVGRVPIRLVLGVAVLLGAAVGLFATPDAAANQAVMHAGAELTRLLRMMALLKLALVAGAVWLVDWRLRFPAGPARGAAYLAGVAVMATGPGLIWSMAHVVLGAALLHGSLLALAVLFLRDEGSPAMLRGRRLS